MKKTVLFLLGAIFAVLFTCIYLIGGAPGAYLWNIAVFILAPLAVVAFFIQVGVLIVHCLKRKTSIKWHLVFLAVTLIYTLPITVLLGISPITYPAKADLESEVIFKMPVENAVLFGGKEYKTHAMWPSECYAFDILAEPYEVGSGNLEDYGIFGENIYSPISGTVIGMEDGEEDIEPNTEEFTSSLGNYLFVRIESTGTYLVLAHLKQNSIMVSVGDEISAGEIIGQVGNSGTTSEPHLHIQHQKDNPLTLKFPTCAVGLPIVFEETTGVISCSRNQAEPYAVNTFEATPEELVEEYINDSKEVISITHYEMSDGTWKTAEHTYKYKLKITGRLHNAVCDTTYILLSNIEDITFEQAWKASGLSSNSKDYFKVEDVVFVGIS